MKLILFVAVVLKCNGFLLDSETSTKGTIADDKRYTFLMDMLIEERQSRKKLEAAVSRELLALKQEVTNCKCRKENGQTDTFNSKTLLTNETKEFRSELLDLRNAHDILELKINALEQNDTLLSVHVHQLEHNLSIQLSTSNITDMHQIAESLQTTNNQLHRIENDANARKQDFIALYHKVVATEDRLVNETNVLKVEQNKAMTSLHKDIVNSYKNISSMQQISSFLASKQKQIERKLTSMISAIQNDMYFLHSQNSNLSATLQKYMTSKEKDWLKYKTHRGFTAENNQYMPNVQANKPVIFDTIVTNIGSRYDTVTGIFTADIEGLYIFFFDIRVYNYDHICWSDLLKNGNRVVTAYSMSGHEYHTHRAESNSAYIHLQVGDKVWIRTKPGNNKSCYIDEFSTFSGLLQYAY